MACAINVEVPIRLEGPADGHRRDEGENVIDHDNSEDDDGCDTGVGVCEKSHVEAEDGYFAKGKAERIEECLNPRPLEGCQQDDRWEGCASLVTNLYVLYHVFRTNGPYVSAYSGEAI